MGFFDKVGKLISGAVGMVNEAARNSDNPELAWKYIEHFNNRVKSADLDELEKMLEKREYEVRLDRDNDYERKRLIQERITPLRTERARQINSAKKEFESWLLRANVDELETGLSNGKYQIRYDSSNDSERRTRLEEKFRPLQEQRDRERAERERREKEEKIQNDILRMRRLFAEYLTNVENEIYKSYYVYCDFQNELSYLPEFQRQILDDAYSAEVEALLSKPFDELNETLNNYKWQISKMKTVAGKSLMVLLYAINKVQCTNADEVTKKALESVHESIINLIIDNTYTPYIADEDVNSNVDELLTIGNDAKMDGDSEKAVAYYLLSAKAGNPEAQYRLGFCFYYGLGICENNDLAYYWFSESTIQKAAEGMRGIGLCYLNGFGVEKNIEKAIKLFQEAYELGSAAAALSIGNYYNSDDCPEKNEIEYFNWVEKSMDSDCLVAYCNAIAAYSNGTGVEKDESMERYTFDRLLETASQQNSALDSTSHIAINWLGRAFYNGWTGTGGKDKNKAVQWFYRGYSLGYNDSGSWIIGEVDQNEDLRLVKEMASHNYSWAQNKLGVFYYQGLGAAEDKVLAHYWILKAAKKGNAWGQNNIGTAYLNGDSGVPQDIDEAIKWLSKAAAQGVEEATTKISEYEAKQEQERREREEKEEADRIRREEKEEAERIRREEEKEKKRRNKIKAELQAKISPFETEKSELNEKLVEINKKIENATTEAEEAVYLTEQKSIKDMLMNIEKQITELQNSMDIE